MRSGRTTTWTSSATSSALVGPEASWLHVGRSRQDMMSTGVSLWLRAAHLAVFDDLLTARQALPRPRVATFDTMIPIYTHGVQAQPTTLAHYLRVPAALDRTSGAAHRGFRAPTGTRWAREPDRPRRWKSIATGWRSYSGSTASSTTRSTPTSSRPSIRALEFAEILSTLPAYRCQLTQDLHGAVLSGGSVASLDPSSTADGHQQHDAAEAEPAGAGGPS